MKPHGGRGVGLGKKKKEKSSKGREAGGDEGIKKKR